MDATRRQLLGGAAAAATMAPTALRAAAQPSHPAADAVLERLFATRPAPALSMAVADAEAISWAAAMGEADLELRVAAQPSHLFPSGSVSKVVTATAAARLASRGVIDLDGPIGRTMAGLPEQHRATTLRQLLTHRGGIRHYDRRDLDMAGAQGPIYMRRYASDADVLRLFIDDPLVAPPGTQTAYSSYGYTLASVAIAAAAGRPFLQLVDEEVARPFGLASLVPEDPWALIPQRAGRYMNDLDVKMLFAGVAEAALPRLKDGWANLPFSNPAYSWAGAGFLMTPTDAARFGAAMLPGGALLTGAERALLFTPMTEASKAMPPLGLGWRIDADKKGRKRWHHAGATPGGCFQLAVYPDQRLAVALAGNVMTMKMNTLQAASDLLDAFGA